MTSNPPAAAQTVKAVTIAVSSTMANDLIKAGWALQATAPGVDEQGYPIIHYSLAWTKDEPVPRV